MDSPTIFSASLDSVFQHWILLTVEDEYAINDRLWMAVGRSMSVFYADYGLIGLQEPEWI